MLQKSYELQRRYKLQKFYELKMRCKLRKNLEASEIVKKNNQPRRQ